MRDEPSKFVVVTVANPSHPLSVRAGATPRGYSNGGLYSVSSAAASTVREIERDHGLHQVSAWPIESLGVHCIVFAVPSGSSAQQVIDSLQKDSRVESVQTLNEFKSQAADAPSAQPIPAARAGSVSLYNDPYADLQRNLTDLAVNEAHEWSRGAGIRVAIIDTGVDYDHPDLKGRVLEHRNFVDADDRQFPRDVHGTQVAGVIAADADNDFGIVGVAPEARLLAYKSCWHVASSASAGAAVCNSFTLAQALEAALTANANIVNLSLSGPADPLLTRLVRRGIERGILFVGAIAPAGVDGGFPSGVAGVLSAESAEDATSDGAFNGRALLAPGHEVLTLVPGGHCDFASGNSFAAAQISGTLALILTARPSITSDQAFRLLSQTSRSVAAASGPMTSVNACAALAEALNQPACAATTKAVSVR
jgi:subtilisin family serine protease